MKNKKMNYAMILFPLILALLMNGGLVSYSVYLTGSVIAILLIFVLQKNKKTRCVRTELFAGSVLLPVIALISVVFGIDKGMAWTGFLRVLVFSVWIYYLMQFTKEERDKAISMLPILGGGMVTVGVIALFIPGLKEIFWMAGRFGGIFQYSNTCALFCIMCMIIVGEEEKPDKKQFLLFDVLLTGVFLTGSKGGILLLFPVMIWILIKKKAFRKNGIIVSCTLVIGGMIYALLFNDFQNVARIYTIIKYPGTLLGRILYMKDALPVMIKNPLGIGYMGYASIQPVIQTGVYTSKFVHNDWMQMALDFGWLFVIVLIWIGIRQLKNRKQEFYKKVIFIVIAVYSMVEFHLQFFFIIMTAALLCDYNEDKVSVKKKGAVFENQFLALVGIILFGYFAVASFCGTYGNYAIALRMFPYDTVSMEEMLIRETDKENAEILAHSLLEQNEYNSQAYNTLTYISLMDGMYEAALDYKLKVLSIERFNMNEYTDFEHMIITIKEQEGENAEIVSVCESGVRRMQEILEMTKENVSPLAYKLKDKPEFTWNYYYK